MLIFSRKRGIESVDTARKSMVPVTYLYALQSIIRKHVRTEHATQKHNIQHLSLRRFGMQSSRLGDTIVRSPAQALHTQQPFSVVSHAHM